MTEGQLVESELWGEGVVVEVGDGWVEVEFEDGEVRSMSEDEVWEVEE